MIFATFLGLALQQGLLTPSNLLDAVDLRHPRVQAARAAVEAAQGRVRERTGAFDPVFSAGTSRIRYNSSSNRGKEYETESTSAGVEILTPGGASIGFGQRLNLGDVKSPSSSTGSLGEYYLSLRIPLLRGNGLNDAKVAQTQAQTGIDIARQDVDLTRLALRRDALNTYWKLVAAQQKLGVAQDLLALATNRRDQIKKRVDQEDLPRIELTEAETEVYRRQGEVIRAERVRQNARLEVGLFWWSAEGTPAPFVEVANVLPSVQTPDRDFSADEEAALGRRPELKAIDLSRKVVALSLDHARADRRPRLDFVLEPGYDFGNDAIGSNMKAGVYYSIPLRQNTVDGRIESATQGLAKIDADLKLTSARIRIDVQDAVSAWRTAYERYQAVQKQVEIASQLERGERIRYESGDSTLFLLIQRENATAEARMRLVDAHLDCQLAVVQFDAATGRLIDPNLR